MRNDDAEFFDDQMNLAFRDTEREIYAGVWDHDNADPDVVDSSKALVDEMSEVEGIDGRPMSELEHAASVIEDDPMGRPIESAEIAELQQQLAEERARREAVERQYQEESGGATLRQVQEEDLRRARHQYLNDRGIFTTDDKIADALIGELMGSQQHIAQLQNDRLNQSLLAAKEKYGEDAFHEAYDAMMSLDMRNPAARGLHAQVMNDADPGEALMNMADNPLMSAMRHRGAPPFMSESYRRAFSSRRGPSRAEQSRGNVWGSDEVDASGFNSRAANDEIFNSVWSD